MLQCCMILCSCVCVCLWRPAMLGFCLYWQPAIFHTSFATLPFNFTDWRISWRWSSDDGHWWMVLTWHRWTNNTCHALEQRAESERTGQFLNAQQFDDDDRTQSDVRRCTLVHIPYRYIHTYKSVITEKRTIKQIYRKTGRQACTFYRAVCIACNAV